MAAPYHRAMDLVRVTLLLLALALVTANAQQLSISLIGDHVPRSASAFITGPDGYLQQIGFGSARALTLSVPAGEYTIRTPAIYSRSALYLPAEPLQRITVAEGGTAEVQISLHPAPIPFVSARFEVSNPSPDLRSADAPSAPSGKRLALRVLYRARGDLTLILRDPQGEVVLEEKVAADAGSVATFRASIAEPVTGNYTLHALERGLELIEPIVVPVDAALVLDEPGPVEVEEVRQDYLILSWPAVDGARTYEILVSRKEATGDDRGDGGSRIGLGIVTSENRAVFSEHFPRHQLERFLQPAPYQITLRASSSPAGTSWSAATAWQESEVANENAGAFEIGGR